LLAQRFALPDNAGRRIFWLTFEITICDFKRVTSCSRTLTPAIEVGSESKNLHKLFDLGYVTVTPEPRIEVSSRQKEEWENERELLCASWKGTAGTAGRCGGAAEQGVSGVA
jgi:hypothetical protein